MPPSNGSGGQRGPGDLPDLLPLGGLWHAREAGIWECTQAVGVDVANDVAANVTARR